MKQDRALKKVSAIRKVTPRTSNGNGTDGAVDSEPDEVEEIVE
jgi:hypothetical protein